MIYFILLYFVIDDCICILFWWRYLVTKPTVIVDIYLEKVKKRNNTTSKIFNYQWFVSELNSSI